MYSLSTSSSSPLPFIISFLSLLLPSFSSTLSLLSLPPYLPLSLFIPFPLSPLFSPPALSLSLSTFPPLLTSCAMSIFLLLTMWMFPVLSVIQRRTKACWGEVSVHWLKSISLHVPVSESHVRLTSPPVVSSYYKNMYTYESVVKLLLALSIALMIPIERNTMLLSLIW